MPMALSDSGVEILHIILTAPLAVRIQRTGSSSFPLYPRMLLRSAMVSTISLLAMTLIARSMAYFSVEVMWMRMLAGNV